MNGFQIGFELDFVHVYAWVWIEMKQMNMTCNGLEYDLTWIGLTMIMSWNEISDEIEHELAMDMTWTKST